MKAIIFDSGTLITLSMSGLLDELVALRKKFNGKFLITKEIEIEIVKKPLRINKYKLGALRLKELIANKTLEFPESLNLDISKIEKKKDEILKTSNNLYARGKDIIKIIDMGEASCLALSEVLYEKGIKNIISVDERTTRVLCENPANLKKILETKLHTQITMKEPGERFKHFQFIRSTELIYIMFKKKLISGDKEMLDAMLYSAKFKGCAVSSKEIKEIEKL